MSNPQRVELEPCWVLHHRPFRDSSRILEVLSESHGRIALVARGSRSAKSKLKGVLRPFLPLKMSWVSRSDLGTLTGAEVRGQPVALTGNALHAAYYANELMINLVHKHDPQPQLFEHYSALIHGLASTESVAALLRCFEMHMLRDMGYAVNVSIDSQSGAAVTEDKYYEYRYQQGLVETELRQGRLVFSGAELLAIDKQSFAEPQVLAAAGRLMKQVVDWLLDGKELKSRKVLRDIVRSKERGSSHVNNSPK